MNEKIYSSASVLEICKKVVNECTEYAEYCEQYAAYEYPMQYSYGLYTGKAESVLDVIRMFVSKMLDALGRPDSVNTLSLEVIRNISHEINSIWLNTMHEYEAQVENADSDYNRGYYTGKISGIRYGLV